MTEEKRRKEGKRKDNIGKDRVRVNEKKKIFLPKPTKPNPKQLDIIASTVLRFFNITARKN